MGNVIRRDDNRAAVVLAASRGTPDMGAIKDVLLADEATFVDLRNSAVIITEEHVIIDTL